MQKKIENGLVAVLYSPGFGAGWYSWHGIRELLFDPKVVDMVLEKASAETIVLYCNTVYGEDGYYGGAEDLVVAWIQQGFQFIIEEYDGAETLKLKEEIIWVTA
jgi:hypothetical protein